MESFGQMRRARAATYAADVATRDAANSTPNSSLVIRNITVDGHRTSIRLEPEMWDALADICRRERCSLHILCTLVSTSKLMTGKVQGSLTAAIRVFIMAYYRAAATESGHNSAGHGSGSVLQPLFEKLAADDQRERRTSC